MNIVKIQTNYLNELLEKNKKKAIFSSAKESTHENSNTWRLRVIHTEKERIK